MSYSAFQIAGILATVAAALALNIVVRKKAPAHSVVDVAKKTTTAAEKLKKYAEDEAAKRNDDEPEGKHIERTIAHELHRIGRVTANLEHTDHMNDRDFSTELFREIYKRQATDIDIKRIMGHKHIANRTDLVKTELRSPEFYADRVLEQAFRGKTIPGKKKHVAAAMKACRSTKSDSMYARDVTMFAAIRHDIGISLYSEPDMKGHRNVFRVKHDVNKQKLTKLRRTQVRSIFVPNGMYQHVRFQDRDGGNMFDFPATGGTRAVDDDGWARVRYITVKML